MIKLDMHKAFDMMKWQFIFQTLNKMGFPRKFIAWIQKCITSSMSSVKINGAIEGYFQSKSGLRQGDPLSPYLFIIGMEVITRFLQRDLSLDSEFHYHWRIKELNLSYLIFADDVLLFCKGDLHSITALLRSVSKFTEASGLRPNQGKS